jgi:hypothetical protein
MKESIVDIPALLFHLKNCPDDFFKRSVLVKRGDVDTNALLLDMYRKVSGSFTVRDSDLPRQRATAESENHLIIVQIGCWFFSHSSFAGESDILTGIEGFLVEVLPQLVPYIKSYSEWIHEEDRAEEFIRLALASCELLPKGEGEAEAADRLDALSTLKRRNVLQESNAALQRIKELRQKMAEEKAREAANVYGRE